MRKLHSVDQNASLLWFHTISWRHFVIFCLKGHYTVCGVSLSVCVSRRNSPWSSHVRNTHCLLDTLGICFCCCQLVAETNSEEWYWNLCPSPPQHQFYIFALFPCEHLGPTWAPTRLHKPPTQIPKIQYRWTLLSLFMRLLLVAYHSSDFNPSRILFQLPNSLMCLELYRLKFFCLIKCNLNSLSCVIIL